MGVEKGKYGAFAALRLPVQAQLWQPTDPGDNLKTESQDDNGWRLCVYFRAVINNLTITAS